MCNEERIRRVMSNLWYQHPGGVHTVGLCSNKDCDNDARGSHKCASCVIKDSAKIVGEQHVDKVAHYDSLIVQLRNLENELVELAEKAETGE